MTTPSLLDTLNLEIPVEAASEAQDQASDEVPPMIEDRDGYRYTGSGPGGAHEHIFVGN